MTTVVLWYMTLCRSGEIYQKFGGTSLQYCHTKRSHYPTIQCSKSPPCLPQITQASRWILRFSSFSGVYHYTRIGQKTSLHGMSFRN